MPVSRCPAPPAMSEGIALRLRERHAESMMDSAVVMVRSTAVRRAVPLGCRRITSCTDASIVATTIRAIRALRCGSLIRGMRS